MSTNMGKRRVQQRILYKLEGYAARRESLDGVYRVLLERRQGTAFWNGFLDQYNEDRILRHITDLLSHRGHTT